ncbi:MAG TPA: SWIM zinc finger family protein [Nocardioidaceae bacterium]|nr:SWIM zinc finger family protein [Nocardioidaceae bacterium]
MTRWSLQAVERAAPDAASLAAGRALAAPGPWSETGSTDALVWGRCQGSGATPYQVSVDLGGPAYRCTCPSRKFPCKHAIALLLLWVRGGGSITDVAEADPDTLSWARTRAGRTAEAATARPARPSDPAAKAKRLEERLRLMDGGVEDLSLWLTDLVRAGTVQAKRQPLSWWDAAAARLVDSQLPGLAERVRELGSAVNRRDDWADHLLGELGRLWTAARAWRRRHELDDRTLADLRTCVGWTVPTEEVRSADAVDDHWQVLGAHRSDDGRLQQQRTWLRAVGTGETVLVLDFAVRGAPLPVARLAGSVVDATVARYPGSWPRRALFATEPTLITTDHPLPPGGTLGQAFDTLAAAWADNPWAARVPVVLSEAALSATQVRDGTGSTVPLLPAEDPWRLAALTGGRPVTVCGELETGGFRPLAVDLDATGEAR